MFPLRGLWNASPREGDKFINCEIDWIVATSGLNAVQFSLAGNSPVALSQIAALYVDNGRSGSDIDFFFPDSAFLLSVPAGTQGLYPVLTNALMFYAIARNGAVEGDSTILQILNSLPPPVPLTPAGSQESAAEPAALLSTNGQTPIVAAPASGTVRSIALSLASTAAATGTVNVAIVDGTGKVIWQAGLAAPFTQTPSISGLAVRFSDGLFFQVSGSTIPAGEASAAINVYYTTP